LSQDKHKQLNVKKAETIFKRVATRFHNYIIKEKIVNRIAVGKTNVNAERSFYIRNLRYAIASL